MNGLPKIEKQLAWTINNNILIIYMDCPHSFTVYSRNHVSESYIISIVVYILAAVKNKNVEVLLFMYVIQTKIEALSNEQ